MLKRKLLIVITIIAGVGFLTGCEYEDEPIRSYYELQSIQDQDLSATQSIKNQALSAVQSQEFNARYKIAFVSTLSAFKNKGYSIESANTDTGVINAIKHRRSAMLFSGRMIEYTKVTAFVEKIHFDRLFIRLNLASHQENSRTYGSKDVNSVHIENPKLYQEMFESIEDAISARTSK
jgi:hypothetical protein